MSRPQIILGIVLFALATAVLYVWGLKKSVTQRADLEHILLSKCAGHIIRYLKKHGTVTAAEICGLISGTKAGQFWSKQRVSVQDPKKFSAQLIAFLQEQQYVEPTGKKNEYRLK